MTAENEVENNDSRPNSLHLPNAEWREADRLGRLLSEHVDEQDALWKAAATRSQPQEIANDE